MTDLTLNGIPVIDTFAEAFDVAGTAIIITNDTAKWAMIAATVMTGFATSVIGCGAEAGIDAELSPEETPDGRPGVRILLFGFEPNGLKDQLLKRVGQCILTCPGTACYAGVDGPTKIKLGGAIRYFGDGFAIAKRVTDAEGKARRYWRIPVMDGEFLCEDSVRAVDGAVGGGNLLFLGRKHADTLKVAEIAVEAAREGARVEGLKITQRPRRNRKADWSRRLVREHTLTVDDLIWPLFVIEGENRREPSASMPGVERLSVDQVVREAERAARLGIPAISFFPYTEATLRDPTGSEALNRDNLVCRAVRAVKRAVPEIGAVLPPHAVGRDYLGAGPRAAVDRDARDLHLSLHGLAGLSAGLRSGFEVHLLGQAIGIDVMRPALKLPGIGRVGLAL